MLRKVLGLAALSLLVLVLAVWFTEREGHAPIFSIVSLMVATALFRPQRSD